jgi:hypothetical protein
VHIAIMVPVLYLTYKYLPATTRRWALLVGILHLDDEAVNRVRCCNMALAGAAV